MVLDPGAVSLSELHALWEACRAGPVDCALSPHARPAMAASAETIAAVAQGDRAVYGVNTGFGKLASIRIPAAETAQLQRNIVRSHAAGVGPAMDDGAVRFMMALKLISLGRGASGIALATVDLLEGMLARDVVPVIPTKGSVGASGDLAPLAHMSAVLMGEGTARVGGKQMPGAEALAKAGLSPVTLGAKEGLALLNGTQFSTAYALIGLYAALRGAAASAVTGSLSTDAIMGSTDPLKEEIHALRGHPGQIRVAASMRKLMSGSQIRESHREGDHRVQDPYCIRCQAQVTGAALDLLHQAGRMLAIEANAATDNPLVLSDGRVVSGGNFHAEPVGFAADLVALAVAEIGAIAQRRVALMVDPTLSFDLPPFLTPEPGLHSGFMIAEVTTAALMSENKHLAAPTSIDSTPTSANQEDHVSMAAHGAVRLMTMTDNLDHILGVEALCAAQGIEMRSPLETSAPLRRVMAAIRDRVAPLGQDRAMTADMEAAAGMVADGTLEDAAGLGPLLPMDD